MAKMTVLEMTQNILSAMDSDEVNSLSDTIESMQVALVIKETFDEMLNNLTIPGYKQLIQLDPSLDPDRPNYLSIPTGIKGIDWIKYDYMTDGNPTYVTLCYVEPEEFIRRTQGDSGNQSGIMTVADYSGVRFSIGTANDPVYWTTFDNENAVFNSYDSSKDTTLQRSKNVAWAQIEPEFKLEDNFTPNLDLDLFPLLLAESKATCFVNFKQSANPREEAKAKRQLVRAQNDFWRMKQRKYDASPNYGRRTAKGSNAPIRLH